MKKSKLSLNEAILKVGDRLDAVARPAYVDAIKTSENNRERITNMHKEATKNIPVEDRFAHQKVNNS